MRLNVLERAPVRTHEGGAGVPPKNPLHELRRAVASCLLWENQFYESGTAIGERIAQLVAQVPTPEDVALLAIEARTDMKLRHAPLWLLAGLAKRGTPASANHVAAIIRRADEMGELLAMILGGTDKRTTGQKVPASIKRGIAKAFARFDAYQLGKYDRAKAGISLKDVLRLVHPKPADEAQAALWKSIIDGTLASPDTWEVALSGGADKKETFERLLRDGKLGYLALLRNLRNMTEAKCDPDLVKSAILARKGAGGVFPFRFIAAARAAPHLEPALDEALCAQIESLPVLPGKTVVLVDVSGSMGTQLSGKSDLTRMDAAAALASIIPGDVRVVTFSQAVVEVPPRRGMAGVEAVIRSQPHSSTYLGAALNAVNQQIPYDRIIVITDEQSHDAVGGHVGKHGYMVNVASYQNGVGYGQWTRIDGFSENILRWIVENESLESR